MFNKVKKFNLNCYNIPVIYQHNNTKCTSIIIDFNVGSMWENEKEKGIAHLVEHLIFKDTGRHSSQELLKKLEINGADINACTSFEFTRFYFTVGNDSFSKTLDLFIEMLMYKNIPEYEFQKEKSTVIQELKMGLDSPDAQVYFNWMKNTFNVDDIVGFEKVLKNITLKDVYRWINKYYIANNIAISINSGFSKNKTKKLLEKSFINFNRYFNEERYELENIKIAKERAINNLFHKYGQTNFKLKKQNQQNHIIVSYLVDIHDKNDLIKLEALRKILSNGLTSVLFREIREKYGYCYTIKAFTETLLDKDFRNVTGYNLNIVTNCMPNYVNDCIKQIKKIMNNIQDLITEEDLIKIKNKHKNNQKKLIDIAELNLSNYKLFGEIRNDLDKIFYKLTLKDIQSFINNISLTSKNITIYGPKYEEDL